MARVFVVLGSTLACSLLGLLSGYLAVKAYTNDSSLTGYTVGTDSILLCYVLAPILGAGIGFGLAVFTLKLFAPRDS